MNMKLSFDQLYTLRHMLGINTPYDRVPKPNRNYAAVNPGDPKFIDLERIGAVQKYKPHGPDTPYDWFQCTESGKLAAMRSHRFIRKSKPQRRYAKYLKLTDCFPGLTFKDFLTCSDFKEIRDSA